MCRTDAIANPVAASGGELGAAFAAAALDDQTAGAGCHAGEKANAAFAPPVGGLKSSFHLY